MAPDTPDTGVLYRADNDLQLPELPPASVDLIYLDPPFFSNRVYEVIWGDEAEVRSFEDRWGGAINYYIDWMRKRVAELHRVLKPTGSLYLHCDHHASHYLKVMLDEVFMGGSFRAEIVWKRNTGSHNAARGFGPVHDVILYYTKSRKYTWNKVRLPYSDDYIATKYNQVDPETGRRYQPISLTPAGIRHGATGQPWRNINPTAKGYHWKYPPDRLEVMDAQGLIYWPKRRGGMPRLKFFLEDAPGRPLQDVWTDIDVLNSRARERMGYPTQKPEALLERIVSVSSNEGDIVLDPFCGCGTTVAVAERLNRDWLGIDISPTAMEVMRRRLVKQTHGACNPVIVGAPSTLDDLKALKPFEFQNWVINQVYGTHSPRKSNDMGIDGYWFLTNEPIQVKQSEKVGRNVVDNFETALRRAQHDSGYIIAFSFTRDAREEVGRARWHDHLNIRLITVKELLRPVDQRPVNLGPRPASILEMPLPPVRKPQDLPTAEELVASDMQAATA